MFNRISITVEWLEMVPGVATDVEKLYFSHMFNFNVYAFDAGSNTWAVFSPVNIERRLPRIYTIISVYLYLFNSHFYIVASIRRT